MEKQNQIQTIYNKYALDLYRYAYSVLRNHEEAEDLVSSVFEKALKLERIEEKTIKSWLFTVGHNLMMDKFKATKQLIQLDETTFSELPDPSNKDLDATIIKAEELEVVKTELANLSPEQREVLLLKTWEDYKFVEIAKILNSSENTVKSHYYRALQALKANIEKKHGKHYAFSFPILVFALSSTKQTIPNLLSKSIMANLVTAAPVAATSVSAKLLAVTVVSAVVFATATIGGGVLIYNRVKPDPKEVTKTAPESIPVANKQPEQSTQPPAKPEQPSQPKVETKPFSKRIGENLFDGDYSDDDYTVSGRAPSDVTIDSGNRLISGGVNFIGPDYKLILRAEYEVESGNGTLIGLTHLTDAKISGLYRAQSRNWVDGALIPNTWSYSDQAYTKTGNCDVEGVTGPVDVKTVPAPCGFKFIGLAPRQPWKVMLVATCEGTNVAACDQIMQSLEISDIGPSDPRTGLPR